MANKKSAEVVTIEDVGPIKHVEIPLQPGRVTLLTGSNGAGKTQSLKAINALAGSDADKKALTVRDGQKTGRISGLGREVKLTLKQTRDTGDISVMVVEDGFSLQQFVNPGYATPEGNDKSRLQNLASVLGIEVTKDSMAELLGGPKIFSATVSKKTLTAADPAAMVASLKKDIDTQALELEKLVLQLTTEADTLEETLPEVKDGETDAEVLSQRLADAMNAKQSLVNRRNAAAQMELLAECARNVLEAGQGETVEIATVKSETAMFNYQTAEKLVQELDKKLAEAKEAAKQLGIVATESAKSVDAAKIRAKQLAEAEAKLKEQSTGPTDEEFELAKSAVVAAEEAQYQGRQLRDAADKKKKVGATRIEASETLAQADTLRKAAKSAINLLVEPINKLDCGIEVESTDTGKEIVMRLVVTNHKLRGRCYLNELSEGELASLVIKLVARVYDDEPALFCLRQESFEGFSETNRKLFLDTVAETQLMVIAAKATEAFVVDENGHKTFVATPVTASIMELEE